MFHKVFYCVEIIKKNNRHETSENFKPTLAKISKISVPDFMDYPLIDMNAVAASLANLSPTDPITR